jgi:hypothetical protein
MDAEEENEYFKYFVKADNEFYDQNPNFAGMNLLSAAAELKEVATERPYDKDGIIGKSGQVLVALCLYCNNNKSLEALQPSDKITKEEKQATQ